MKRQQWIEMIESKDLSTEQKLAQIAEAVKQAFEDGAQDKDENASWWSRFTGFGSYVMNTELRSNLYTKDKGL